MKTYEGICRGGPHDGKMLAHYASIYCITFFENTPKDKPMMTSEGCYHHVLGQWIWRKHMEKT